MGSMFGFSMPAGAWNAVLPGEEPEEHPLHCRKCGAFLPRDPVAVKPWEEKIAGPDRAGGLDGEEVLAIEYTAVFSCKKCGCKSEFPIC